MADPLRFAIIVASTRQGRFADVITDWFVNEARTLDIAELDVVDLAEIPLPTDLPPEPTPGVKQLSAHLNEADAFIVVTPEYNHSFPASLKHAIDLTFEEWHAKPVAFVSYGGISGGLRAVEQLRSVFAEMHAVTIRDTVSFHGGRAVFDEAGQPKDPEGPRRATKRMLEQLHWWALALRDARMRQPYAA
jgi:NAD(P)H-dependent FMN reductase